MYFIGTDIVNISRFSQHINLSGSTFITVFSSREITQGNIPRKNPSLSSENLYIKRETEHYAGLWAAKESFIKAWSQSTRPNPPLFDVQWNEIEILKDNFNRPQIYLSGNAEKYCKYKNIEISISHDSDYAIANCLLEI